MACLKQKPCYNSNGYRCGSFGIRANYVSHSHSEEKISVEVSFSTSMISITYPVTKVTGGESVMSGGYDLK
jgi:hypothetical protein